MGSYYSENRKFYLKQIELGEIVENLEDKFRDNGPAALNSVSEALQWYDMVLANAGDICENFIAVRAPAVDQKGASFENGVVNWAPETEESMRLLAQAGYMGGCIERKYRGLNLPLVVNTVIIEMVSQADASLMNLFGLQDIAVTIAKFCSENQKARLLPKLCSGKVSAAMALTEPDAGSDLQAVKLRAVEKDGQWYLNGVKRFITNGCGDVSLVLARSEQKVKGAKGLSMFLYERYRDNNMVIRRIENKLGIHGSPTCEMQFNMAKAELVGKRRFGLIRYVKDLMDGARLAVSAQAVGIAQAAFEESVKYANEREQFDRAIVNFPAVYQMLKKMQIEIETCRLLLYNTASQMDRLGMLERLQKGGKNVRSELKLATTLVGLLTPLTKYTTTEMVNKVTYDAVQIHGGCGFMKNFPVERLARDARITNIYEGTSQLQVVAAVGGITTHVLDREWSKLEDVKMISMIEEKDNLLSYIERLNRVLNMIRNLKSQEFTDYVGNYLVEIVSLIYRQFLFLQVAETHQEKRDLFRYFANESEVRIDYLIKRIRTMATKYGNDVDELKKDFI